MLNCRLPIQQFLESYCNAPLILKCIMKRGNRLKVISLKCRLQVSSFFIMFTSVIYEFYDKTKTCRTGQMWHRQPYMGVKIVEQDKQLGK